MNIVNLHVVPVESSLRNQVPRSCLCCGEIAVEHLSDSCLQILHRILSPSFFSSQPYRQLPNIILQTYIKTNTVKNVYLGDNRTFYRIL